MGERWAASGRREAQCGGGADQCAVQDVLFLDLERTELAALIALGNAECGTDFPIDVTDAWAIEAGRARQVAAAAPPSRPPMSLVGELEARRTRLWQDPIPTAPRRARRLPDGSWTCPLRPVAPPPASNGNGSAVDIRAGAASTATDSREWRYCRS